MLAIAYAVVVVWICATIVFAIRDREKNPHPRLLWTTVHRLHEYMMALVGYNRSSSNITCTDNSSNSKKEELLPDHSQNTGSGVDHGEWEASFALSFVRKTSQLLQAVKVNGASQDTEYRGNQPELHG